MTRPGQYVVLDIVIDIAVQTGDSVTAIDALEDMLDSFCSGPGEVQTRHPETTCQERDRGAGSKPSVAGRGDRSLSKKLSWPRTLTSLRVSVRSHSAPLGSSIGRRGSRFSSWNRDNVGRERLGVLSSRSNGRLPSWKMQTTPKANLDVGQYYCLIRGEWEKGLPLLAKGSNHELKRLAQAELRAPTRRKNRLELADGWWQLGEQETAHQKNIHLHLRPLVFACHREFAARSPTCQSRFARQAS